MKLEQEIPSWAWNFYQAIQTKASNSNDEADEEVLNFLVQLFHNGRLPATEGELNRLINNHMAGRRQKIRRRNGLFAKYAAEVDCNADQNEGSSVESVDTIRSLVTAVQWKLLYEIAAGASYREVSDSSHVPIGTVKSLVSRIRTKLRPSVELRP